MKATILVVEDEALQSRIIRDGLEAMGFATVAAQDGAEGLRLFLKHRPDLIVLDVLLPDLDGWAVCRRIRESSDVPIIFTTVKGSEEDRIKGLKLGADDYLVKPIVLAELRARVAAVLRRFRNSSKDKRQFLRFRDGELVIAPETREVMVEGERVDLTSGEYQLLIFMAKRAGRVVSVYELSRELWPEAIDTMAERVRWRICRLRSKIEKKPGDPQSIVTERGLGYRFTEF